MSNERTIARVVIAIADQVNAVNEVFSMDALLQMAKDNPLFHLEGDVLYMDVVFDEEGGVKTSS